MATSLGTIKRGDSFNYYATWAGATLAELSSQVRTANGRLLAEVTIEETTKPDMFRLFVTDTSKWPFGLVYTDIQRRFDGNIVSSETMEIEVQKDVSR